MEKINYFILTNKYINSFFHNYSMSKDKSIILFHTEEFKFEKKEKDGLQTVILSGNAQPLNEDSRNGVRYRPESVKKAYKSLANVAFLFNHDSNISLGHTIESDLNETHVTYKVDLDPEEKQYIRKIEREDIKHVSVGCMVENVEFNEEENIYECDVKEYVELSLVPVPGFSNTSVNKEGALFLAEKLGDEKVLEKLKAESEKKETDDEDEEDEDDEENDDEDDKDKDEADDSDDDEDEDKEGDDEKDDVDDDSEEKKEEADDPEESAEEKLAKTIARVEELFSELDGMKNRLAIIEANVDALNDSEEDSEPDKEKDIEPNKEEKFIDNKKKIPKTKEELEAKEKSLNANSDLKSEKEIDLNKHGRDNRSFL